MNLKDQVLSIEQIKELRELEFDINKHSSLKSNGKQIIVKDDFYIGGAPLFPTMSIGDIIEALPTEIDEFILNINRKYVAYDSKTTTLFYAYRYRFINSLFDCLVWCIKQKYINLK